MKQSIRYKKIMTSALAALAFVYLINLLVDNPYTHKTVRAKLDELLAEKTNLSVDYQVVRVQMIPPALDLYGLEVRRRLESTGIDDSNKSDRPDPGRRQGNVENGRILQAAHIRASLSIWSLLIGQPQLGSFEVDESELRIDNVSRLDELFKASVDSDEQKAGPVSWPPSFNLPIRAVVFRNAAFSIFNPGLDRQIPMTPTSSFFQGNHIDLEVDFRGWDDIEAKISAVDVTIRGVGTTYISGATLESSVLYNTNTIDAQIQNIDSTGLKGVGFARVTVDQVLPVLDVRNIAGVAELDVSGDIRLAGSLLQIAGTYGQATAKVKASFDVPLHSSENNKPRTRNGKREPVFDVQANIKSAGAKFGGFKLLDSSADLDINADRIVFNSVEIIESGKVYATGSGLLELDKVGGYSFLLKPQGFPLGRFLNIFNVDFSVFDTEMTSDNLAIVGTSEPFDMKVSAAISGANVTLPSVQIDRRAFPDSPLCQWGLQLAINSAQIDFDGTTINCRGASPQGVAGAAKQAHHPEMRLELAGAIRFDNNPGLGLKLAAPQVNLAAAQYFAQTAMAGVGQFSAQIHGPFENVVIDGKLAFDEFAVSGAAFGRFSGNWRVAGDVVSWENVRVVPEEGASILIDNGSLEIRERMTIRSEVAAANLSPQFIKGFFKAINVNEPLEFGIESVQGSFGGYLDDPLWWDVKAGVSINDVNYDNKHFFDNLVAKVDAGPEGWRISSLIGSRGDMNLDARLKLTRNTSRKHRSGIIGDDNIEIKAKLSSASNFRSNTDHISTLPYLENIFSELGLSGFTSGEAKLGGTIDRMEGSFDLSLLRPRLLGSQVAPVRFKGIVAGGRTEILVSHGGNALEGRFVLDYGKKSLPYEWYFSAKRMDLRFVASPWFADDPRNYLYMTGGWSMRGDLKKFWNSNGELSISGINGRLFREVTGERKVLDFNITEPFAVKIASGAVVPVGTRSLTVVTDEALVRATVRPAMKLPNNIDLGLDGQLDLALIRDLVPLLESASGRVAFKGGLSGSLAKPVYSLEINDVRANPLTAGSWEPVSIGLADFRPPLKNIRLRALLKNGALNIESLTASKGSGRIDGAGTLVFGDGDLGDSNLDFRFEDASVVYPVAILKSFDSNISGNVSLTGKGRPYRLSGDLRITRARSTREIDLGAEILGAIRQQNISIPSVATAPAVSFDLSVHADQSVNVNNRLIQALLSSNLRIGGTDQQPSVLGQVDVNRGKFVYKRDFSITRGVISFDDPLRVDPTLEVSAVSEIQNYRVYISISGRASAPKVDFSIDPPNRQNGTPISKVDILVLLGRGSLPEEQQSLGETQNVAATEALGFIWGQLDEPIEKLFDMSGQKVVKEVYFDTYASPDGKPLLRVNLPLNLGNDLDVVLRVDQEQSMKLSSEFEVSENISLGVGVERLSQTATTENQTTVPADTGADLKFRFAFP